MTIFNLPDLGEGLAEAEINQWHVKEGDTVAVDQLIVSVETAKAIVDVPSPYAGRIKKLYGINGSIIQTGSPLIEFEIENDIVDDKGTVAGKLLTSNTIITEAPLGVEIKNQPAPMVKALPAVRALARKYNIDLATITPTGHGGQITFADIEAAALTSTQLKPDYQALTGVRRAMAQTMSQSHAEVVPVTIFDNIDIHHLPEHIDITVLLIRAMIKACSTEPALNAWYDGVNLSRKLQTEINIGIAVDTPHGLFVPVIKDAANLSDTAIRTSINQFKEQAVNRSFAPEALKDATIVLSNFGTFAGRYATPIIVPPCVAILGVGRIYEEVKIVNSIAEAHRVLPLSLSFDHRSVTGGEATRFLQQLIISITKT